jgi:hypothetical protein
MATARRKRKLPPSLTAKIHGVIVNNAAKTIIKNLEFE